MKYGPHGRNVMDVWLAKSDKPTPVLVSIHDGGSATLEEAVLRHAGDAAKSKSQYSKASDFDRRALLAFLESLRAPKMP